MSGTLSPSPYLHLTRCRDDVSPLLGFLLPPSPIQVYAFLSTGLQSIDAVALGGPSPGEGPPPLLLRLPLPPSEEVLPEVEGWAGVAGEAGVVEGAEAGSGVEGEEAVVAAGS